ncbi:methionine biosynthesis protein MetW [Pontixanthobacter gangjinensis]|uniref:Methionine biosynthesis protein MetW n=1 Tax=Pontixanthobacter gangjinensis TaxID=1028742 RepID=A0A6I4SIV8_9SPHN|nr:methionine biosynthesis protein MetW [Pontixanthobacter gangjinensis]MXO55328.1 methionine biosynthesis protein MetW [Pontixanthobacter gangjinensis]
MSVLQNSALRPDLAVILDHIAHGSRALDVGCGDGVLMAALRDEKQVDARGIEIDGACVERCVARGLSVVQGDADRDLTFYPDGAFDYAILSQTLQTAARPDRIMQELLRVGRRAFVSFPNFAYWRMRKALLLGGRMPVTRHLPVTWYETQNIHHVTVKDFEALANDLGITISNRWFFTNQREISASGANWRAEYALFEVGR